MTNNVYIWEAINILRYDRFSMNELEQLLSCTHGDIEYTVDTYLDSVRLELARDVSEQDRADLCELSTGIKKGLSHAKDRDRQ